MKITIAALALLSVTLVADEPTFRGDVRTVAVYATVMGADGRLVPDLPRDAFSILDNGRRQDLTLFANDVQPITVVMLLDRSGSMKPNFSIVQEAAERFVDVMLPSDKARIGSFSNRIQVDPRDFTSDHEELHRILRNELQDEGPTPLWNAVNVGITALLHQKGRRVILVFTDGMDAPPYPNHNNSLKDVMKRAEEEDVMVYAIGFNPSEPSAGGGGWYPRAGGFGGGGFGGGFGGFNGGGGRPSGSDHPDEGLLKIAAATGGGYFELASTNDLAATFARVAEELHRQYALGFAPDRLDGKMHSLDVRVTGNGRTVRARRSYLARVEGNSEPRGRRFFGLPF
jgi:VWFA-related protein